MIQYEVPFYLPVKLEGHPALVTVACSIIYTADEPYQIVFRFHSDNSYNEWTFARDILIEGLECPTGEGDVKARADEQWFTMTFANTESKEIAEVWTEVDHIKEVVNTMLALVPRGKEVLNFDEELQSLMEG